MLVLELFSGTRSIDMKQRRAALSRGYRGKRSPKDRAVIPPELCEHIVGICEREL